MFAVPKYSEALNALREKRGIPALFSHNLVSIDVDKHIASFKNAEGAIVEKEYSMLHVTPPMGPLDFIKNSPLADGVGWVDVHQATLQHKKFKNVYSLGDASSLPTSKTAAAITAQAPILVHNLVKLLQTGEGGTATYDGYTSCPVSALLQSPKMDVIEYNTYFQLLTGYEELMLAEFLYGLKPSESFAKYGIDQAVPRRYDWESCKAPFHSLTCPPSRRAFYYLKKDFFPYIYFSRMVQGKWFGRNGFTQPVMS